MTAHAPCPTEQEIAALVDGALSDEHRAALETHVAGCSRCFDLVATLGSTATQPLPAVDARLRSRVLRPPVRAAWTRIVPAISAAAVVLLAVTWWRTPSVQPVPAVTTAPVASSAAGDETVRGRSGDAIVQIEEPKEGSLMGLHPEVRWNGPAQAVSYEVQVTSATGDVLWTRQVEGAQRSLRIDATLPPGETCYLWVAAYLPEGRRVTSGVIEVRAADAP